MRYRALNHVVSKRYCDIYCIDVAGALALGVLPGVAIKRYVAQAAEAVRTRSRIAYSLLARNCPTKPRDQAEHCQS